ncbi:serine/threonine-protein kinase [Nonomuraea sp. NPDC049504]|uniref:WD40 repeat domain-containing serine/threonine protein kinase n=1 Tax=Nonomuraea sp. NPDC049504 TaxID=3154729 RepID=UPI00342E50C2
MRAANTRQPRRIGPYRVVARLGGGGMGEVFLGRSPGGREVAVKVVRPELADDPDFRRRFATEITAARRVGGFHTAEVVAADPDGDPPWLATAYVRGPSLHDAVRDHGPLPLPEVAALGAGLAEGLGAVHACQIVHRDLKPGNVILAADGPRLIDFGIARALDTTSYTRTAAVLGTAAFMAPEQVTGHPVGPAADVFALGCVLAFAASGRGPYGEGPAHAITHRIVYDEPDLSGLPEPLAELIGACLAKDPADRPRLAHVMTVCASLAPEAMTGPDTETRTDTGTRTDAETVVTGYRPPIPPTLVEEPPPSPPGRARYGVSAAVIGVAVLLGGTLIALTATPAPALVLAGQEDTVDDVAFGPGGDLLATAAGDRVRLWDARTGRQLRTLDNPWPDPRTVAFAPAGDRVATSCDRDACLFDPRTGRSVKGMTGHTDALRELAFSRDGRLLASASRDGTARLWAAETGEHLRTLTGHLGDVSAVAFAPDGQSLATAAGETIRRWDVTTGEQLAELVPERDTTLHALAFAPDGSTFASGDASGDVFVWDARTNRLRHALRGHGTTVNDVAYSPDGSVLVTAADAVRLWNPRSGRLLKEVSGESTRAVAFSPDGTTFAAGGQDGVTRLWRLDDVLAS